MPYSSRCLVASGSCVVDEENISGKGKGTILAAYTALQSAQYKNRPGVSQNEGQMILYSLDEGMNFKYFENNPAVSVPDTMQWRDPKIFIIDKKVCMVVYETFEGSDCASFYTSDNCRDWEFVSRSMDLYECPDLFPLTISDTGETLWVLYGAEGKYRIGTFKNFEFKTIESGLYIDYGTTVYAGQTFNNYPDDTFRYHLAWMRDKGEWCMNTDPASYTGRSFNQSMSLMCKLSLHKTKYGYRLFRNVSEDIKMLRTDKSETQIVSGDTLSVPAEYIFKLNTDNEVTFRINEQGFTYNPKTRSIVTTGNKEYTLCTDEVPEFRMFSDRRSIEFFVSGEISMSFCAEPETDIFTMEGVDKIDTIKYNLESIWK